MMFQPKSTKAIIIIYLFSFLLSCNNFVSQNAKAQPREINNISSITPIGIDIAIDKRTIHLIWINDDHRLRYQKSSDAGKSWSAPSKLVTTGVEFILNPRIYASGDTISVFWRYNNLYLIQSTDGGATWGQIIRSMKCYDFLSGNLGRYNIVLKDGVFYAVYGDYNRDSLSATFFVKSSNAGKSWSKPVQIAPYVESDSQDPISIDIDGNTIHVLCHIADYESGPRISRVYLAYSDNLGDRWFPTQSLINSEWGEGGYTKIPTINFTILSKDSMLTIFYQQGYSLHLITSRDNGVSWQQPGPLFQEPILQYSLHKRDNGTVQFIWTDERNKIKDWKSRIPLYNIIASDDLEWNNNDLYSAIFEDEGLIDIKRLTPQGSYVEWYMSTGVNSISSGNIDGEVIILWAGKRKMDRLGVNSPEPFKIFQMSLPVTE
jgi:hypothetical protein